MFVICTSVMIIQCDRRTKSELVWDANYPRIGSQSSPRATDLNRDGTLDIVIGAGRNEYQQSDQGVLAIDGRTGELLWQQSANDQVYGTATLYDVTGDGVDDVFIGGRGPQFRALDGTTGRVLWQYDYHYEDDPVLRHARFNFNNAALIPDQNGNGIPELITINGGNSKAAPFSAEGRYPGVVIMFDAKTGVILAADTTPDGRESYMSPVSYAPDGQTPLIIFGTGGETISGNLYVISIKNFMSGQLSRATVIASEEGHGFISPVTLADITSDGVDDVIAISHGSTIFAIDGNLHQVLWKLRIPSTESSNSIAPGYFTDDDVPDFFTFVSKGQWPNSTGTLQVMIDGKTGSIAYTDSIGCTGFSSPVVIDMDGDGRDEVIISVNDYDCNVGFTGDSPSKITNRLLAIDFKSGRTTTIDQQERFKNVFTTPWIGDLDDDGYLDIVHCQYFHHSYLTNFLGMRVKRIATAIRPKRDVQWGAYMGSKGDGTFRGR